MSDEPTRTELRILDELDRGVLRWGAAVGACWPTMVQRGWVERNFGEITEDGRRAAEEARQK